MKEVCEIAKAHGHPLEENIVEKMISMTQIMVPYKTSMLLDFENNRKMEVEAILGNAVRMAKSLSVPHLNTMYSLLSFINEKLG